MKLSKNIFDYAKLNKRSALAGYTLGAVTVGALFVGGILTLPVGGIVGALLAVSIASAAGFTFAGFALAANKAFSSIKGWFSAKYSDRMQDKATQSIGAMFENAEIEAEQFEINRRATLQEDTLDSIAPMYRNAERDARQENALKSIAPMYRNAERDAGQEDALRSVAPMFQNAEEKGSTKETKSGNFMRKASFYLASLVKGRGTTLFSSSRPDTTTSQSTSTHRPQ